MTEKKASLATRAVRGASWTIATGIGSRALGLVGTLALTYFLTPAILGEVSDASILVLSANQLSTIGVGQYVIAKRDAGREATWHATVFHLVLGAIAILAVVLFKDRFGVLLHAPDMAPYVPGLAVSVAVDRVGFIPERLLARDMRFRVIGLTRTAGEIAYTVSSVSLAMLGWGGAAVVWGNIVRSVLRTVILCVTVERAEWLTPSKLTKETTRSLLAFGLPFSVSATASFASRRWDNLVVSRLFGPSILGEYNLAYNLADIPAVQVGEQIGDVLLPSFSQMEAEQRKAALIRSTGLLALVVFPLAVGLGAVAPTAIHTLLRKEWRDVAPMLTLLSALSVVRPVGWTIASYLTSRSETRTLMWLGLFHVVFLILSIWGLGHFGPLGACVGVGVAFGGYTVASLFAVSRLDGISAATMLARCATPLLACIPLALAVLGARAGLTALDVHVRGVGLVVEILAGGVGYVVGAFLFARTATTDLVGLLKRSLRRGK